MNRISRITVELSQPHGDGTEETVVVDVVKHPNGICTVVQNQSGVLLAIALKAMRVSEWQLRKFNEAGMSVQRTPPA